MNVIHKQLTFDDLPVPPLHLSERDKFAMTHSRRDDPDTSVEAAQNAHSNAARHPVRPAHRRGVVASTVRGGVVGDSADRAVGD